MGVSLEVAEEGEDDALVLDLADQHHVVRRGAFRDGMNEHGRCLATAEEEFELAFGEDSGDVLGLGVMEFIPEVDAGFSGFLLKRRHLHHFSKLSWAWPSKTKLSLWSSNASNSKLKAWLHHF